MKLYITILLLSFPISAQDTEPKPNVNSLTSNVEVINKHLQGNYKLEVSKKFNIVLTGAMVEEFNSQLKNKTYTNFKIEF